MQAHKASTHQRDSIDELRWTSGRLNFQFHRQRSAAQQTHTNTPRTPQHNPPITDPPPDPPPKQHTNKMKLGVFLLAAAPALASAFMVPAPSVATPASAAVMAAPAAAFARVPL